MYDKIHYKKKKNKKKKSEHGTTDWFEIGKGVCQGYILSPCLFNLYAKCKMPGWMKHKLKSRLPGEISITSIGRWHHPHGRKQRGTKKPLDEGERGEWKSWLKTQHSNNEDHSVPSFHGK